MEREIRFRIFNPHSGRMMYDIDNVYECLMQQLRFDKSLPLGYDHYSEGMRWMEFTGLKDKHGKDIYEGDVMKHQDFDRNVIVMWYNGCWCLSGWDCVRTRFDYGEIIGNIYQHPDLCKS